MIVPQKKASIFIYTEKNPFETILTEWLQRNDNIELNILKQIDWISILLQ